MPFQSRRILLQTLFFTCLPNFVTAQNSRNIHCEAPNPASWLQLKLINGDTTKPEQLKGQVLITYFWASWCPFCAEQTPEIEKLFVRFQGKGLNVLGVSVDRDLQAAKAYLQKHRYSFPSAWIDPTEKSELKKPTSVPLVLVYNKSGQMVQQEKGQMFAEDVRALSRWINA